jgi:hypothetical protein
MRTTARNGGGTRLGSYGGFRRRRVNRAAFGEYRVFLLAVDYSQERGEPESTWARVRLNEDWDLVGSEVTLLGDWYPDPGGRFVPESLPFLSMGACCSTHCGATAL